jgi:opacity protein-like surface antigen
MGLSEREQKVLDELERGLYADDSGLADRLKAKPAKLAKPQNKAARALAGALVAVAGLSVLLVGLITHYTAIGVAGFAVILFGVVVASSNSTRTSPSSTKPAKSTKPSRGSFFEDRWDKRINGE